MPRGSSPANLSRSSWRTSSTDFSPRPTYHASHDGFCEPVKWNTATSRARSKRACSSARGTPGQNAPSPLTSKFSAAPRCVQRASGRRSRRPRVSASSSGVQEGHQAPPKTPWTGPLPSSAGCSSRAGSTSRTMYSSSSASGSTRQTPAFTRAPAPYRGQTSSHSSGTGSPAASAGAQRRKAGISVAAGGLSSNRGSRRRRGRRSASTRSTFLSPARPSARSFVSTRLCRPSGLWSSAGCTQR
mmetsp:Transcript_90482/g.292897  ORF Transcript_90482/g.292897 Transcript_90482/m.292897 type:complete len:243 (+) Transcript_90482:121-849(+)